MKFNAVTNWCQNYMKYLESDDFHPDEMGDWENKIYEAAMEAVHGEAVHKRITAVQDAYDKREEAKAFRPTAEQWQTLLSGGEVKTEFGTFSNLQVFEGT